MKGGRGHRSLQDSEDHPVTHLVLTDPDKEAITRVIGRTQKASHNPSEAYLCRSWEKEDP